MARMAETRLEQALAGDGVRGLSLHKQQLLSVLRVYLPK